MSKIIIAYCLLIFSFYKKKKYIIRNKTHQIYDIKVWERSLSKLMFIPIGNVIFLLLYLIYGFHNFFLKRICFLLKKNVYLQ